LLDAGRRPARTEEDVVDVYGQFQVAGHNSGRNKTNEATVSQKAVVSRQRRGRMVALISCDQANVDAGDKSGATGQKPV
jgi:hypothetical protein